MCVMTDYYSPITYYRTTLEERAKPKLSHVLFRGAEEQGQVLDLMGLDGLETEPVRVQSVSLLLQGVRWLKGL